MTCSMEDQKNVVDNHVTNLRKCNTSSTSNDLCFDLPEELLYHVLAFLPISSLLRFRSVCKSWNVCVKDPRFQRARASIADGGEHFVFYHEFINLVFRYSASSTSQLVTCAGGFLLLENVFQDLHVVDPANVCLKEVPGLDLKPYLTVPTCRYTVGMVVSPGTKDYSIFVASKDFDTRHSFRRGPISVHQYDSTQNVWRLACSVPLAPMELHCELVSVAVHRGSVSFLIMGRTEIRLGGTVKFRVSLYDKHFQRWENLSEGFPSLKFNLSSIPLLFAYRENLYLAAPFLGRYLIWQYDDVGGEWTVLDSIPPELACGEQGIWKTQICAQHCGDHLYVGKWPRHAQMPSVMMYDLLSREFREMPSERVQRAQLGYWPGSYGRRFLFEPVQ